MDQLDSHENHRHHRKCARSNRVGNCEDNTTVEGEEMSEREEPDVRELEERLKFERSRHYLWMAIAFFITIAVTIKFGGQ